MATNLFNAPVVIPGAQTLLANGVQLNTALTTAQELFAAPPGMVAVVTAVVLRKASTSMAGTTSFSVGTATANDIINASTAAAALPSNNQYVRVTCDTPAAVVQSGAQANLTFAAAATAPGTVECDVLGFLTAI